MNDSRYFIGPPSSARRLSPHHPNDEPEPPKSTPAPT
jgi:hypothetical protein